MSYKGLLTQLATIMELPNKLDLGMTEPLAQASWMLLPRFSKHDSGSERTQVNSESLQSLTWL